MGNTRYSRVSYESSHAMLAKEEDTIEFLKYIFSNNQRVVVKDIPSLMDTYFCLTNDVFMIKPDLEQLKEYVRAFVTKMYGEIKQESVMSYLDVKSEELAPKIAEYEAALTIQAAKVLHLTFSFKYWRGELTNDPEYGMYDVAEFFTQENDNAEDYYRVIEQRFPEILKVDSDDICNRIHRIQAAWEDDDNANSDYPRYHAVHKRQEWILNHLNTNYLGGQTNEDR